MDLTSPGAVVLDTTVVPDVVGLHAFDDKAALVQVLPSDFPNIGQVLVPDDRAAPHGFHDLLIDNLSSTEAHVRPASAADLTKLKQQWPSSRLTGMTDVKWTWRPYVGVANASLAAAALGTAPIVISTSTPAYPVTS